MKVKSVLVAYFALLISCSCSAQVTKAPAYPLITHDPYFSIWSANDTVNAATTTHWTGTSHSLTGFIKVDNQVYRFLGKNQDRFKDFLPAGDEAEVAFKYLETDPGTGWNQAEFKDAEWKSGLAPFSDNPNLAKTLWKSKNIWARRTFDFNGSKNVPYALRLNHDDNAEIFLNGELIYTKKGYLNKYIYIPLNSSVVQKLMKTGNVLAIHLENTRGGAYLDAGIVQGPIREKGTVESAQQVALNVTATQTTYDFKCGKVDLKVKFTSPLLANDLDLISRPVSYVTYSVKSNDGAPHNVDVFLGTSSDISVNVVSQKVEAQKATTSALSYLKAGTVEQPLLKKRGDDLRIDWGDLYVAVPKQFGAKQGVYKDILDNPFLSTPTEGTVSGKQLTLGSILPYGKVDTKEKSMYTLVAYNDGYSVQYFGQNLRPWWNRNGNVLFTDVLNKSAAEYTSIMERCAQFDTKLYLDATAAGGKEYAYLCVLAYRQSIAAHKLVESPEKEILFLSKENNSNGSINTVDITYPSAPMYLYYNTDLLKGMMNGIFYYSESGKWKKPFPAHDLGTYPLANGQTYGEDMPVEEAGNMLILAAAIAKVEGNANYAKDHWKSLTTWTEYLKKEGFDPANQLSTDDFAGHLARNTNLSIKAILGLRSYAMLAEMLGETKVANEYKQVAQEMAQKWEVMANAGDHYALTFDNKNTWSQKYNMVWDKLLGFNIFPAEVVEKEIAFYLTKQNDYGLPLDSRKTYTKSDWILWTATMANNPKDFQALIYPVYKFAIETPGRVPLNDWHETTNGKNVAFKARSVVSAYYIKMLEQKLKAGK